MAEYRMYAPDLVCICIDEAKKNKDYVGKIWDQYQETPVEFYNMTDMLFHMEQMYDRWNFPQSAMRLRSFGEEKGASGFKKDAEAERHTEWIWSRKGRLATFVVYVKFRQNATWQGDVLWVERQKKMAFDSSLTLVKLIDSALENG